MHIISDNDLFQRLAFDNPWWALKPDTEIRFRHPPQRIQFAAFKKRFINQNPGDVLLLSGPLRAGKTVMLRQLIANLIEGGVAPNAVFYAPLTTPSYTATDLSTLFEMFCRRYRHGPDARIYVIFDEVQYIPDWQEKVQALARMRPNARIACAISSAAPGLVSGYKVPDTRFSMFVLPPLSFLEFMRFRGSEEKLFAADAAGKRAFRETELPALNAEFLRYINFGGFPEGIMGKTDGAPAPTFIRDNLSDRVLHKDIASLSAISDTADLNKLFTLLAFNTGRELSIEDLAKVTNIAKNTLRKYLDFLEGSFLIRRLTRVDQNAKKFQRAVAFRAYLTSPCLYTALFGPLAPNAEALPRLVATAVVGQLLGADDAGDMAYASWRGGALDLLFLDPETGRPTTVCDIDWTDRYSKAMARPETLAKFVANNNPRARANILTGKVARQGSMRGVDIRLIPAALYCYVLHRDRLARQQAAD